MEFPEAFVTIMKSRGLSRRDVAALTGRSLPAIHNVIHKGNPSVDVLAEYAAACGYRVALVPAGARLPEGAVPLEGRRRDG